MFQLEIVMADLPSGRDIIIDVGGREVQDVGQFFGKSGLRLESYGQLHTDIYGLSTATANWVSAIDASLSRYLLAASYLDISSHGKRTVSVEYGLVRTIGEYAGFEGIPVPVIEYCTGVNEEPIQTHPNFGDFAGTPSSPQNGAIFVDPSTGEISSDDAVGVFERFWSNPPNAFSGVSSWLMPVLVQRTTQIGPSPTAYTGMVGHLQGGLLCTNVTVSKRGIVYQTTVELRAGGPRGWNTAIYS
jgi:hypothetical protein